ncbi:hypothetical protein NFI96_001087 [Prochilodus magdalenae]|nr:hypothetical protein NFI96_001087 [Prochilodus magdalenae]
MTQVCLRLDQGKRSDSPEPSCVSMKSNRSVGRLLGFRKETSSTEFRLDQGKRSDSSEPSCVSMKSDQSMGRDIDFRKETSPTEFREQKDTSDSTKRNMDLLFKELEHKVISLVKNQLKRIMKLLSLDYPACSEGEVEDEEDQSVREEMLRITLHVLRNMNQTDLANTLQSKLAPSSHQKLKSTLKEKCQKINEGISNTGTSKLLNEIYTELYITEGGSGEVNNEHELASVDVLLTNLVKGNLLPSALLWITTRPAAANQIPPGCIDQVTEVRGFSDAQKEEYFRKRISEQSLAERIITHVKSSRSLYIMCHIPVFCWIAATVLERMLDEAESGEIPKTLTQMFTHFLIFQIKHSVQKYERRSDVDHEQTRKILLALGKLAFHQLDKGNLIFYEEDLMECGTDVREVSVYSGVCTQIFREEFGLHLGKVFSFVHLSVQEFLAALYVLLSFISNNRNVLLQQDTGGLGSFRKLSMSNFLKSAVDKTLQSENGHLDLFLRFLLGLSLESNQTLLRGALPQTGNRSYNKEKTIKHIKEKIRENPSPEKTINLFHCLNELNDHSLVQEVQTYLNRGGSSGLSGAKLTPAQWSAVAFVMLNSEEELEEFDLSKFDRSEECLLRLLPVAKVCRKVVLSKCSITEKGCAGLVSALKSNPSHLRELNLNYSRPGESGMKLLSDLLEDSCCKLEKLELEFCSITEKGCAALVSALNQNPSHLRELNLNYNKPGESGVKLLSDLLKDPHYKLEKLEICDYSTELDLNWKELRDSQVKSICDLLEDPDCKLEKLQANLNMLLPKYYQHLKFPTGGEQILDHCYTVRKDSYKPLPRPAFGKADHTSILLLPAYKQRLKQAKPVFRSVYQWSEEAIFTLQDCFETTDWQMIRDAAGTDINEYTDSITSYISKCTDDIVPKINVRAFPNQKLRINTEVQAKLRAWPKAYNTGDLVSYKKARYDFQRTIRLAKRNYRDRVEPNYLICLEATNTSPATKLPVDQESCAPSISVPEEVSPFKAVNPRKAPGPDGIHSRLLIARAIQLAEVFTDIFNLSLRLSVIPTCFKRTTIVPVPKTPAITCLNDLLH